MPLIDYTCPRCGGQKATKISETQYRCEYCDAVFSPIVSHPTATPSQSGSQPANPASLLDNAFNSVTVGEKNRIVAAVLAIFLGTFGAHHFYLGNTKRGILYVVFFWTYVPAILGFIEGLTYLGQSDATFAQKNNLL